jgi:hypothetical protein
MGPVAPVHRWRSRVQRARREPFYVSHSRRELSTVRATQRAHVTPPPCIPVVSYITSSAPLQMAGASGLGEVTRVVRLPVPGGYTSRRSDTLRATMVNIDSGSFFHLARSTVAVTLVNTALDLFSAAAGREERSLPMTSTEWASGSTPLDSSGFHKRRGGARKAESGCKVASSGSAL